MCKLRGFGNVLMLLLLGRSFHEVKKFSCPSICYSTNRHHTQRYIWNERRKTVLCVQRPLMTSTCMCTVSSSWRTFSLGCRMSAHQ
ncbi:unnamed protein product [Sphagnum troendelagicum]|uniref:Secreted protein n=1 Tax=Sphagnum troendelagicum TaxID=128251 RepID=A0ABP0TIS2_9BRYO